MSLPYNQLLLLFSFLSSTSVMQFSCAITLFSCAVTPFIYAVTLVRRAVLLLCNPARLQLDVRILGTKANFKMAAGLLFLTFFAFRGTSGNQTENNVNIFLIVKLFDWTFLFYCLKTTFL